MTSFKPMTSMQHTEHMNTTTAKKTWSDPAITILSIKNDTLGAAVTGSDGGLQWTS